MKKKNGGNDVFVEGRCPECGYSLKRDMKHSETYCLRCGLIVELPYPYVGGFKIELPMKKE